MSQEAAPIAKLVELVERVTPMAVRFLPNDPLYAEWTQDGEEICVPEGDWEGLLHEFLHWVVATEWERGWANVALNADEVLDALGFERDDHEEAKDYSADIPDYREHQVCLIERDLEKLMGVSFINQGSCTHYGKNSTKEDREYAYQRLQDSGVTLADLAATYQKS